ncbi:cytidylate kinase [Chytriomyces sp. MP71]|nr:cytidylate kinase [Chytriomyces sp. MP71]
MPRTGPFQIAIDGVASTGKSATARRLAQRLPHFVHIDSGAMYRCVTLKALQHRLDAANPQHHPDITALAQHAALRLGPDAVLMDEHDVTHEIRSVRVSRAVSAVAAIAGVRTRLVALQQELAHDPSFAGIVMEGRDIGSTVLPNAHLKLYLDGLVKVRAQRRLDEMKSGASGGPNSAAGISLEILMEDVQNRDMADMAREISPLRRAEGAVVVDTSYLTLEEQVSMIEALVHERLARYS